MEPFTKHTGLVVALDRANVDTDQIIPKQFLKRIERSGFGQFLFYDWRFREDGTKVSDFELNLPRFEGASILLTRGNFGCGSSREHAPWALLDYGFRVILAPSYADIFFNNCFKNGILPIVLKEAEIDALFVQAAKSGYRLSVDLERQVVFSEEGWQAKFKIDGYRRQLLLKGLDDIAVTLQLEGQIKNYERSHSA